MSSTATLDSQGPTVKPGDPKSFFHVKKLVTEAGLIGRRRGHYLGLGIVLTVLLAGTVTGFILLGDSWFQLLMAGALGLLLTQFAFLAHEAAHRQILASHKRNDKLGQFLANIVVGISYQWWMNKHNKHHATPNTVGKDPDIEWDTISFQTEDAKRQRGVLKWITNRQGYLFFPLLTLEGLNLHMHSVRHLMRRQKTPGRFIELGMLAVRTVLVFGPIFAFLPLGKALAFVAVMLAVFGVYMGGVFAPNHKGMPIIAPDARLDFFSKQVRTSRNIRGGWWATSLMGGLNYQIEHHLFPSMARPYLAQTRLIVQEFCKTEGVPYTETTLRQSYARVIAYLNEVGLAARDPFECPLLASRA